MQAANANSKFKFAICFCLACFGECYQFILQLNNIWWRNSYIHFQLPAFPHCLFDLLRAANTNRAIAAAMNECWIGDFFIINHITHISFLFNCIFDLVAAIHWIPQIYNLLEWNEWIAEIKNSKLKNEMIYWFTFYHCNAPIQSKQTKPTLPFAVWLFCWMAEKLCCKNK